MNDFINRYKFPFLTIALVVIVDISILPWYFPPTEGWWETYAWLMAGGIKLYSDIWVSHPPLHILLMKGAIGFVGYDFFMLRVMGVMTHGLAVGILYFWLERLTNRPGAFIGALLSTLLIIYPNTAYIARDYHSTVGFFVVLALFCSLPIFIQNRKIENRTKNFSRSVIFGVLGTGFSCGALILTKQNIGVFFTAFVVFAIILSSIDKDVFISFKRVLFNLFLFVIACAFLPLLITLWMGSDWLSVYFSNTSKGSVGLVLTRFLVDETSQNIIIGSIISYILFFKIKYIDKLMGAIFVNVALLNVFRLIYLNVAVRILIFAVFCYLIKLHPSNIVFSVSLSWLLWRVINRNLNIKNENREWYKFGWLPLIGLVYCGTHTAGYNFVSMQFILAAMFADSICYYQNKFHKFINLRNIIITGIFSACIVVLLKLNGPLYNWWGLKQEGLLRAKYALPFDELRGFRVDKTTSDFYEIISKYDSKLQDDEAVFAYPSIPIIYLLLNKLPPVKLSTLWFDVSNQGQFANILNDLETQKPEVIFWLKPPIYVYNGHAQLRRLTSLMAEVDLWLYEKIRSNEYIVEEILDMNSMENWESNVKDLHDRYSISFLMTNNDLTCTSINNMEGILSSNCNLLSLPTIRGSVIDVEFQNRYYALKYLRLLGVPLKDPANHYFIVLKKNHSEGKN